jgi:hypothetical protein
VLEFRVLALHVRVSCAAANVSVIRSTAAGGTSQIELMPISIAFDGAAMLPTGISSSSFGAVVAREATP